MQVLCRQDAANARLNTLSSLVILYMHGRATGRHFQTLVMQRINQQHCPE